MFAPFGSAGRATVLAAAAGLTLAAIATGSGASAHQREHGGDAYVQVNLVSDQPGIAP